MDTAEEEVVRSRTRIDTLRDEVLSFNRVKKETVRLSRVIQDKKMTGLHERLRQSKEFFEGVAAQNRVLQDRVDMLMKFVRKYVRISNRWTKPLSNLRLMRSF